MNILVKFVRILMGIVSKRNSMNKKAFHSRVNLLRKYFLIYGGNFMHMARWMFLLVLSSLFICTSCSIDQERFPGSEEDEVEPPHIAEARSKYEQTIKDFQTAVKNDDPQALYDLVDLNYEGEVYWTDKEAQDLIDLFLGESFLLERQVRLLEEDLESRLWLKSLGVDHSDSEIKRIPYASAKEGFVFLQSNGKLAIKTVKHLLNVNENSLGDFDKIILHYETTDRKFEWEQATIAQEKFTHENNDVYVDVIHFGPGNYDLKGTRIYQGEEEEMTSTIELTVGDMNPSTERKDERQIRLSF